MKKSFYISFLALGCLAIITVLYISSRNKLEQKNGFNRIYSDNPLKIRDTLAIKYSNYYISGMSEHYIFLGNYSAPFHTVMLSKNLRDTVHINIPISLKDSIKSSGFKVQIDSPRIAIIEGKTPHYVSNAIPTGQNTKINLNRKKFDAFKVLSDNSLLIRFFKLQERVLQKITFTPNYKESKIFKLQKNKDSNFELDGFLSYNKTTAQIFYTYFYSNNFICLDTNLNLLYAAHTIDTNTTAKIKVSEITYEKSKEVLMSAPPLIVNKRSCANGKWFYLNSGLASDQENIKDLQRYSPIDVYRTIDGKYSHSLKIPNYLNEGLSNFAVSGKLLVALYKHHIITYQIN